MKMKRDPVYGPDVPQGFGMALAQNPDAMDAFSALSEAQQRAVLKKSARIRSRAEMRSYVDSLVGLTPEQME